MPNRILRDGINTSERVNALTPGAELFFRRAMSICDDYGRYHGHPTTLRAGCWPTNPEVCTDDDIRAWLAELTGGARPLIRTYTSGTGTYIELDGFHQRIQAASKYPSPPWDNGEATVENGGSTVNHCESPENHGETPQNHRETSVLGEGEGVVEDEGDRPRARGNGHGATVENTRAGRRSVGGWRRSEPEPETAAVGRSPGELDTEGEASGSPDEPPEPEDAVLTVTQSRKPPGRADPLAGYDPATVQTVRNSLGALALSLHKLPPDDGILARVLAVCRGASGAAIAESIRALHLQHRFDDMRSWGLVATVLAPYFQTSARSG
jgi:hypothetical protein